VGFGASVYKLYHWFLRPTMQVPETCYDLEVPYEYKFEGDKFSITWLQMKLTRRVLKPAKETGTTCLALYFIPMTTTTENCFDQECRYDRPKVTVRHQ